MPWATTSSVTAGVHEDERMHRMGMLPRDNIGDRPRDKEEKPD